MDPTSVPVAVAAEPSSGGGGGSGGGGTPVAVPVVAFEQQRKTAAAADGAAIEVTIEVHDGGHEVTITQTAVGMDIRVLNANTGDRYGSAIVSEDLVGQDTRGTKHQIFSGAAPEALRTMDNFVALVKDGLMQESGAR